ncbi:MAG TPA: hypothetical protein VHM28_00110 [Anaerolineales bacterium]|jgi:hypothetical protein|nr:hypothetical protein [Anaerolineales bacterium]
MNIQNVNHTVHYFVHAYRQAPWRIQRQWIGTFLLAVLGLAMVAALYLDVTAQAAIAGRDIQNISAEMIAAQHDNGDLQTKLAELTSTAAMEERAQALGYQSVEASELDYVIVPGYSAPKPAILTAAPLLRPAAPSIPPEYTQSLLDWLDQRLRSPAADIVIGVSQ